MRPAAQIVAELHERVRSATAPAAAVPWFMDIDGVLNIIGKIPAGGWGHYERIAVFSSEGYAFPVVYAPDLMYVLNELSNRGFISVRWLTTWEQDAYNYFAPAVGLRVGNRLAGVDHAVRDAEGLKPREATWWKLRIIREHLAATEADPALFVWTDDEIADDPDAMALVEGLTPGQHLVINCDPRAGIRPEHIHLLLDAIEALPEAEQPDDDDG